MAALRPLPHHPAGLDPLDRHQLRRGQSIPTLTMLAGPLGLGVKRWRNWAATQGRAVALSERPDLGAVVSAWVDVLHSSRNLVGDAVAWLAAAAAQPADELRSRLGAMTRHDFDQFWSAL